MQVLKLNPDDIFIGDRFRKEFSEEELENLTESIRQFGQLQPIGVRKLGRKEQKQKNKKYELIFGHRRLIACKRLGIQVKAVIIDSNGGLNKQVLEFIENSVRQDFSPAEKAMAVKQLHDELSRQNENWSIQKTASVIGMSRQRVSEFLRIAEEINNQSCDLDELKTLKFKELKERFLKQTNNLSAKIFSKLSEQTTRIPENFRIVHTDVFRLYDPAVLSTNNLKKGHFNMMVTSPKWEDHKVTPEFVLSLANRFLNDEGILLVFCPSLKEYLGLSLEAERFYFRYKHNRPIIWIKQSIGTPKIPYTPSECYEFVFFAKRKQESLMFNINPPDWFNVKKTYDEELSYNEKPESVLYWIMKNFMPPQEPRLIDPFCGYGASVRTALSLGFVEAVGITDDLREYEKAQELLRKKLKDFVPK